MIEKVAKRLPVLAAGDEAFIREFYQELVRFQSRYFQPETVFNWTASFLGAAAADNVQKAIDQGDPFGVVLIHFAPADESASFDTTELIQKIAPYTSFVALSESAEHIKEIRARIPPDSKMVFVQRPFHPEEILQFVAVLGALWQSQQELQQASSELLDVNSRLMETNDALSVLARNLEGSRRKTENHIIMRIRTLIMPIIKKLQQEKRLKQFETDLDLLTGYIESLTSDMASDLRMATGLSKTELQVASLIKNGMTSDEIAAHLNVSLFTVKTHRKHIRKKLDIQNSGVNLRSYLESGLKEV